MTRNEQMEQFGGWPIKDLVKQLQQTSKAYTNKSEADDSMMQHDDRHTIDVNKL